MPAALSCDTLAHVLNRATELPFWGDHVNSVNLYKWERRHDRQYAPVSRRYTGMVAVAKVESAPVEPQPSMVPLAEAARAHAARKLGRVRMPVRVVVELSDMLEVEGISVEVVGVSAGDGGRITDCLRDIIVLLARGSQRLTTAKVIDGLDKQHTPYGETTVKTTLSQAIKDDVLTNRPDAKPPGYGLPNWS